MSYGYLIVLEPRQPETIILWTDVEGELEPSSTAIIEMVIPQPIVKSILTYRGEQRTVYLTRNGRQCEEITLNPAATELLGVPVHGPFVINIVKGFF
jgi:hypothetical protein